MSRREILWRESWINIRMMLADAPRYLSATDGSESVSNASDDDLRNLAGKLNNG